MQIVFFLATKETDFSIFLIFAFSILIINLIDETLKWMEKGNPILCVLFGYLTFAVIILLFVVDRKYTFMKSNYGFFGIILPVLFYLSKRFLPDNIYIYFDFPILFFALLLDCRERGSFLNMYMLFAFLLLPFYSRKRGNNKLKYFFYVFYPLHFVVLEGLNRLLQ